MDRPATLLGLVAILGLGAWPAQAGPRGGVTALLVNGGFKAPKNYESHLVHLEQMRAALLGRGLSDDRIHAFISDGGDPRKDMVSQQGAGPLAWLLEGTPARSLLPPTRSVDTTWDGPQQPATTEALGAWFADSSLRRGDTLLVYVTDHGYRDRDADPPEAGIWLWGEKLPPETFGQWLAALEPGVRTVMVMSQCYSGAFAELAWADGPPSGDVCGFFSVPADRPAYGCYPDGRSRAIGHGFRFIDALAGAEDLPAAQGWVSLADRTPDVPLSTSDLYLASLLEEADGVEAWLPGVTDWSEADAIAAAFGLPQARSLADLDEARARLDEIGDRFGDSDERWASLRQRVARDQLSVLVDDTPRWKSRIDDASGREEKDALRAALLVALEEAGEERGDWAVTMALRERDEAAEALVWRLKTRAAALDRMAAAMVRAAGEVMLAQEARRAPAARGLRKLIACESAAIGRPAGALPPLPEPYPSLDEEAEQVEALIPSLLGIRFEPLPTREARRLDAPGAVRVKAVTEGSPAGIAGVRVDDVLTGIGGVTFQTPYAIQARVALAERGAPVRLVGVRSGAAIELELVLVARQ
ncbi:MAG: hypothetical protein ACI8S6_003113 [Myxococcota bacterium]|jgi:hypothetical protein